MQRMYLPRPNPPRPKGIPSGKGSLWERILRRSEGILWIGIGENHGYHTNPVNHGSDGNCLNHDFYDLRMDMIFV